MRTAAPAAPRPSQKQGWEGLRGTFGLLPSLWAKFRVKHLILLSMTKILSLEPIDL